MGFKFSHPPPGSNTNPIDRALSLYLKQPWSVQNGGKETMDRKIIIKTEDLDREIHSLLTEVGADMPMNWDATALAFVRDAVIEAFGRMGVTIEVDERLPPPLFSLINGSGKGRGNVAMALREAQATGISPTTMNHLIALRYENQVEPAAMVRFIQTLTEARR
jgi:hypothetical protein